MRMIEILLGINIFYISELYMINFILHLWSLHINLSIWSSELLFFEFP